MNKMLFFFALLITSIVFAQNDESFVDSLVAQKLAELEMQDNPEYFLRKDYCDGNIQMFVMPDGKRCVSKSTYYAVYVFWKEEGENKFSVQKFDNCGRFMPFSIVVNKAMAKSLKNKEALKTEEVKPYEAEKDDANAYGNMSVASCHKDYEFVFDGNVFQKSFKEFDLSNDSTYKNVNSAHNKSLSLIKLDSEISEIVKNFEDKGKFFREN
jgi:hypothetical protein